MTPRTFALALGLFSGVLGCASHHSPTEAGSAAEAYQSSRARDEGLSPFERERREFEQRLSEDRRRAAAGDRR